MPGPAIYVAVVIGTVATAFVFKEFVYDPHIAPKVQQWKESLAAKREIRRRRRQPVAVPATNDANRNFPSDDDPLLPGTPVELETLVAREVNDWRNSVHSSSTLRQRHNTTVIDEINDQLPYPPMEPSLTSRSSTFSLDSPPDLASSLGNGDLLLSLRSPSVAALPMTNLASFATDVDFTASIYESPFTQGTALPSVTNSASSSPQVIMVSPFVDPLVLSRTHSQVSDVLLSAPSEGDDVLSFRSGLSSPVPSSISSVTESEDHGSDGESDESWADVENDPHRR